MKELRFKAIMAALSVAYGEIDALIWRIREDFENGVIPAARARREYATARARFMVVGARYYRVAKAGNASRTRAPLKLIFLDMMRILIISVFSPFRPGCLDRRQVASINQKIYYHESNAKSTKTVDLRYYRKHGRRRNQ